MDKENHFSLKVSEALNNDVGKALARMDQSDLSKIGASIGDIVKITGKSSAYARVMPCHTDYKGKGIVQIDGILRENAGAGIDDYVDVSFAAVKDAVNLHLAPSGRTWACSSSEDMRYIARNMDGIPAAKGNRIRLKLLGYSYSDYTVIGTEPEGAVVIRGSTLIKIDGQEPARRDMKVSYEDIGGLQKQVQRIREMIELPLKYPEVFNRLGIDAPKGVLLYGSPGTGKTLIARAVANEADAYFIHVNGPEIIHKFYGESEAKLRNIFENAGNHAPSIIFLDEIDAIAPKRENVSGEVEKRVVAQLLALMDGLKDRGQIIVIGATNIPNSLDPALRRPGRFDREIEIGIPDRNDRAEILRIHTREMPLGDDVDIERLADITHGFVGADLESLCREAAMTALRKILPDLNLSGKNIPYDDLSKLKVTMEDFYISLSDIEPSAIREVFVDIPNISFDDIGGLGYIKEEVEKAIVWPQKYNKLFREFGCQSPKGILFYGSPGTGKTMVAKAIASLNNANFISIKGPELLSKWVGESERAVRDIFKKAKQASPCVIFFDEIDSLVPMRGTGIDSDVTGRVLCQMLTEIDGVECLNDVLIIGATNRLDIVDKALLRPGRFDMLIEFKLPDCKERIEIFRIHMRGKPVESGMDLGRLSEMTEGYTGADIMEVCQKSALDAMSEYISRMDENTARHITPVIKAYHFENAIKGRC